MTMPASFAFALVLLDVLMVCLAAVVVPVDTPTAIRIPVAGVVATVMTVIGVLFLFPTFGVTP